jgi:hypothetical protein
MYANSRPARDRRPRMMNYSGYWNYPNKIEEVEINQGLEVDHQHPPQSLLLKPNLKPNLNLNHNPNDRYLNHNSTLLLNLNQLHWILILLLVFGLYILSRVMKLEN